ncbi:uncharacterized protein CC84DRAFT_1228381 [Paraphaeosphaeria sporulosa]|uniref:Uncharacterized protein n=1 Tax=Paraphaeosphaeria sporulosa TaxID=1460663 RepID=A0A177C2I1_9PLEO|nr:uncharacterized protein CC84DRAFT_1228381 [Paraphaeosphaeria sporulosa]OAG01361.1 hypothetical protein CC84DRAFT_1228381 [Paraphaeosphaeria sporulosa]
MLHSSTVTPRQCFITSLPSDSFLGLLIKLGLSTLQETARLYAIMLADIRAKASGSWRISCVHPIRSTLWAANSTARGGHVLGLERYYENFDMYKFTFRSQRRRTLPHPGPRVNQRHPQFC